MHSVAIFINTYYTKLDNKGKRSVRTETFSSVPKYAGI